MTLPVFETPRLTLRSITAHDAESLHEAYGDADAMRYWDHPPSRDVTQTAERIRMSAEADPRWHGMWAIQTHAGRFVGAINYHAHNEGQRRLALGWIVVPSCWRQGLMAEAAPPVISHCFRHLNVHRIEARIEPENSASRRLAAKLGFAEEGILRDWLCVAGEFRSVLMYSLLRADWMTRSLKAKEPATRSVLRPMTESEYAAWLADSIRGYAREKVASGQWAEGESLELSTREYQTLLPDGLKTQDNYLFSIIDSHSASVGMLWFAIKTQFAARVAYVFDVYVRRERRREGHAYRAFSALEEEARRLGLSGIALHVFGRNTGAQALYARLGFRPTNISLFKTIEAEGSRPC